MHGIEDKIVEHLFRLALPKSILVVINWFGPKNLKKIIPHALVSYVQTTSKAQ